MVDPAKIKVVPYGPNLESGFTRQQVKASVETRLTNGCNFLFVGKEWYRKGGNIALETVRQLRVRGVPARLWIVGCSPPESVPDYVTVYGYLSKNSRESEILLKQLYSQATFLIMPSRAENYGVAIVEASSYGVPSLASDVGGIAGALQNGLNGLRFSSPVKPEQICDYVLDLLDSPGKYSALAESSFELYQSKLNWKVAGERIQALFKTLI
jgi:glycosyltransferase involved in cell wall biosynthesis